MKKLKLVEFCEEVMRKQEEIQEKATEDFQKADSSPSSPEEMKRDRNFTFSSEKTDDDSFFGRYLFFLPI